MVLVAPLVVTAFALRILFGWVSAAIDPIVTIVLLVTLLGYVARWSVSECVFGGIGRLVNFLPLVRTIYSSTRQVANTLIERSNRYESVVLVEYREDYSEFGFVTGEAPDPIQATLDEPAYNVFVPNSPNPTSGRLLLIPESRVREVDISVRRGIRTLVTTGIAAEEGGLPRRDETGESDKDRAPTTS